MYFEDKLSSNIIAKAINENISRCNERVVFSSLPSLASHIPPHSLLLSPSPACSPVFVRRLVVEVMDGSADERLAFTAPIPPGVMVGFPKHI